MESLKGAIALLIVAYHYWAWGIDTPANWAVNLAQFGVVLFFVMSGYGLTLGYYNRFNALRFWQRRLNRIAPWFWITTLLTVVISGWPGLFVLFSNFSFIWPLFDLRSYIATGAWTIGCEIIFYFLFYLWSLIGHPIWVLPIAGFISYIFGQVILSPDVLLVAQWDAWINPLVQLLPFVAGCAIGLTSKRFHLGWSIGTGLFFGLCLTIPTPIAVYWFRPLLIVAECLIVIHTKEYKPLSIVGTFSYQIYLLHPVAWQLLGGF